jgi:hypothetical protein
MNKTLKCVERLGERRRGDRINFGTPTFVES